MKRRGLLRALAALACAALLPPAAPAAPADDARVRTLVDAHWQYTLRTQPELASLLGDGRYNDRLRSVGPQAVRENLAHARRTAAALQVIAPQRLSAPAALDRELLLRDLRLQLAGARFHPEWLPVNQFEGVHVNLPMLVPMLPFRSARDYDDYAQRLAQVPRLFEETIAQMRAGLAHGLVPPREVVEQVARQAEAIAAQPAAATALAWPVAHFPPGVPAAERPLLEARVVGLVDHRVLPAYRAFASFVRQEYLPHARDTIGLWALPQGDERYALAIRAQTTTTMTPQAIHQLGLSEVARIEQEQLAIVRGLGYSELTSFNTHLRSLREVHPASAEAILDEFRQHIAAMEQVLPRAFGRLPRAKLEVVPVERFRQAQAPAAAYSPGTPDGSRPGRVYVNTFNFATQLTITNESTAFHEGVPGHHLQKSIAQELPALSPFRQQENDTAYVEGWAVYTERLGKELGFYRDPYKDYGRLEDEKWRAIRLVVDTGIHAQRWSREQVMRYMRAHSTATEDSIAAETDRYIAIPAQALAYKIGQLTILRLREEARARLGARFDLRRFHDFVLGAGALPLDVLERRVRAWDGH